MYGGGIEQAKKAVSMKYYGRATIPWSLECESIPGLSRADVVGLLSEQRTQDDDVDNYYLTCAFYVTIFVLILGACATCCL